VKDQSQHNQRKSKNDDMIEIIRLLFAWFLTQTGYLELKIGGTSFNPKIFEDSLGLSIETKTEL
jgi:hypothetical protein